MAKYVIVTADDSGAFDATLIDSDDEKDEIAVAHESSTQLDAIAVVDVDYRATSTTVEVDSQGRVLVTCHLTEEGVN